MIENLERYFYEVLNVRTKIRPWKEKEKLPFFLIDSYEFYEVLLFDQSCLFMVAREGVENTPATIKNHWQQADKRWTGICIYVQKAMSAYNRKRLIEHRVSFVVPGNQMYLPEFGIELREHFRKLKSTKKSFNPATQAALIYALLYGTGNRLNPSELAKKLGYTLMTMTRAFDELEAAGVGEINRTGRERWWLFKGSKRALWEQTKPLMRNPIKYRKWLKEKKPRNLAGLSALSQFSLLNPPSLSVYAISFKEWKDWKDSGVIELPLPEEAAFELEIWHYDPKLFAKDGVVDPYSLYLSLKENDDERIISALEKLMEEI